MRTIAVCESFRLSCFRQEVIINLPRAKKHAMDGLCILNGWIAKHKFKLTIGKILSSGDGFWMTQNTLGSHGYQGIRFASRICLRSRWKY